MIKRSPNLLPKKQFAAEYNVFKMRKKKLEKFLQENYQHKKLFVDTKKNEG